MHMSFHKAVELGCDIEEVQDGRIVLGFEQPLKDWDATLEDGQISAKRATRTCAIKPTIKSSP